MPHVQINDFDVFVNEEQVQKIFELAAWMIKNGAIIDDSTDIEDQLRKLLIDVGIIQK